MITMSRMAITGRMGNQLHQLAFLIGVAAKNGYEFGIPKKEIATNPSNITEIFDLSQVPEISGRTFKHHMEERAQSTEFNPNLFKAPDGTNYNGFFQSYKYFEHAEDKLLNVLKFRNDVVKKAKPILESYGRPLVGIHVRRTDFIGKFGIPSMSYYRHAVSMFPNAKFLVFSDDVEWCKKNFKLAEFPDQNYSIDFYMLCHCDAVIMANSTFSWWAGWFCHKLRNGAVIMPADWGFYDKWDIFYPGWIKV